MGNTKIINQCQPLDTNEVGLLLESPHSGQNFPSDFQYAVPKIKLLQLCDAFVDELFSIGPKKGATLLAVDFPRSYIDVNRGPDDFDAALIQDLPNKFSGNSERAKRGLSLIWRLIKDGRPIYGEKGFRFEEAQYRLEQYWHPYHNLVKENLQNFKKKYGKVFHISCHSMPSVGGNIDTDAGTPRADFVLGDCFGKSCMPAFVEATQKALEALGYSVALNVPYSGGYLTSHYGRPQEGVHSMQIEVNRALYMDEKAVKKSAGFPKLQKDMGVLINALIDFVAKETKQV